MDVAAVFLALAKTPVTRHRLETAAKRGLTDCDLERLAALAFLHDIGKLHPAFQAKGWPKGYWCRPKGGHTTESHAFAELAFRSPDHPFYDTIHEMARWGPAIESLLAAMFAHHGRPADLPTNPTPGDWPLAPHYDWRREAEVMATALMGWFPLAFEADARDLPDEPSFCHLLAGFAALADWIGSDTRFFCYREPFDIDYNQHAHRMAAMATQALGQSGNAGKHPSPTFQTLTGFDKPNATQEVLGSIEPTARLVILEAETGSGKTEAALWRFAQLLSAREVSSLYFALPTRAAARQLHGRIQEHLNQLFGSYEDDAPEVVLAIPGALKAGDHEATRLPDWEVRWDDDSPAPNRWAAEHATRFLSAEVAVGTVDQAMLAALTVKHAHMRGSALSRSLLVVDEIHASDPYMTTIAKNLVDAHLAVGGHALLMSATLGARGRIAWRKEQLPAFDEAETTPYPAVWVKGESTPRIPEVAPARGKVVAPELVATMAPETAAKIAIAAAKEGARVLVVRNTVDHAVETWQAIQGLRATELLLDVANGPALHHGRFAAEDRALLDTSVAIALATSGERGIEGCIVVGTQTLEQSLDIDADFLVTDLCPMDVLLQRIGRLHRHALPRPRGFEKARVVVLVPQDGLAPLVKPAFENGLGAWKTQDGEVHFIYGNLAELELTRRLVESHKAWRIPRMNRELVEGATHPDRILQVLAELGESWQRYHDDLAGVEAARRMAAGLGLLQRESAYGERPFPPRDEWVQTRLGEEGVVLDFSPAEGPFGQLVSRISLPSQWSQPDMRDLPVEVDGCGELLAFRIGEHNFEYSRAGLLKSPEVGPSSGATM